MDNLTQAIISKRNQHSEAKLRHRELKEELDLLEASLFLSCDYKELGSNEAMRKAKFAVDVLAKDEQCARLNGQLLRAEELKDVTWVELENLIDQRRAYENALRAAFIKGRYGVIVTVEHNDDYSDFELQVMDELYFNE